MTLAELLARTRLDGDCYLWTGAVQSSGYGTLRVDGRTVLAHRYAYELARGPIRRGLVLMHTCDRRLCIRVEHLEPGTHAQNMRDMRDKHRGNGQRRRPVGRRYW